MGEMSELERLVEEDKNLGPAARFQERARQWHILNGLELPPELGGEAPAEEVRVARLTPALLEYVQELLEGRNDLKADALRLACGLPLPGEQSVFAGQSASREEVSVSDSLCSPTRRYIYHSFSGACRQHERTILEASSMSVALAA